MRVSKKVTLFFVKNIVEILLKYLVILLNNSILEA